MRSVMISCVQRRDERALTLPQLIAADLNPVVIESPCDPAGGPLNRLAAYQALQVLGSNGGLFFEDDIDIDRAIFGEAVRLAAETNEICTLFLPRRPSLYPTGVLTAIAAGVPIPLHAAKLENTRDRRGYYGSQAVYLPGHFVMGALRLRSLFMTQDGLPLPEADGFDFYIKDEARAIYGVFPNPVQHRNPPKMKAVTRGNAAQNPGLNHTSLTYGWRTQ